MPPSRCNSTAAATGWSRLAQAPTRAFPYDCETPRHRALLHPHSIAQRCVTNGEWQEFIADGGYDRPDLWLSEGWDWRQSEKISRPLYWNDDNRSSFTLAGRRDLDRAAPVAHVSYYEADAYARWAGARLPREAEWEDFFASADPNLGNQLDRAGPVLPKPGGGPVRRCLAMDPVGLSALPRLQRRRREPSVNIMANSCAGSSS